MLFNLARRGLQYTSLTRLQNTKRITAVRNYASKPFNEESNSRKKKFIDSEMAKNLALGYAIVFGIAGTWLYLDYKRDPLRSSVDRVIRLWTGPYRDYIVTSPESEVVDGTYICHKPGIKLKIPENKFVRPGLILRDNVEISDRSGGSLELEDDYGNYIVLDWVELDPIDEVDSKTDPIRILIKNYNRFKDQIEKSGSPQSEKYIEIVDTANKITTNGPPVTDELQKTCPPYIFSTFLDEEYYRAANVHIHEHHGVRPNNNMWNGSVLFLHDKYFIAITSSYPNNMINFAIVKENMLKNGATEEEVRKKLSVDTSLKIHQRLREMEDQATDSRSKIIQTLRQECIGLLSDNFKRDPTV
ncbi:histidine tRS [Acrasis kona]|uniref:Histidine tRS n=1 Tax=Acrasis kona TaxID=1008807 RepID=A0AAW2ZNW3_9EUKA